MGKDAFAEVFIHPPSNSSQIIHPERYFEHVKPTSPALPKLSGDVKDVTDGSMGEFDHQMLLQQYLGAESATALAPHLLGGQFRIVIPKERDSKPVLLYAAAWDSPHSAADYFEAYRKILQAKWQHCETTVQKANMIAGTGDNGFFVVWLSRNVLSSVEGLKDADEWHRLQGLGGL
jgi:hemolysin-activating ACP:hemolysin acyltransferase